MADLTTTAYRITFKGWTMPKPAVRYLSTLEYAETRRQQFAKMGLETTKPVVVRIRASRVTR